MMNAPKVVNDLLALCVGSLERPDFHPERTLDRHIAKVQAKAWAKGDLDLFGAATLHDLFKPIDHGGELKRTPDGVWYVSNPEHPVMAAHLVKTDDDVKHWLWAMGADWKTVMTLCMFHMEMKHVDEMNRKSVWKLNRNAVEMSGNGDIWNKLVAFRSCDDMLNRW